MDLQLFFFGFLLKRWSWLIGRWAKQKGLNHAYKDHDPLGVHHWFIVGDWRNSVLDWHYACILHVQNAEKRQITTSPRRRVGPHQKWWFFWKVAIISLYLLIAFCGINQEIRHQMNSIEEFLKSGGEMIWVKRVMTPFLNFYMVQNQGHSHHGGSPWKAI